MKKKDKKLTERFATPLILTSRKSKFNKKIKSDWGFKGNAWIDKDNDNEHI